MDGFRKNKDLAFMLRNSKKDMGNYSFLVEKICEKLDLSEESVRALRQRLITFTSLLKGKWVKAHYTESIFLKQNQSWLENDFTFPKEVLENIPSSSSKRIEPLTKKCSTTSGKKNIDASGERMTEPKMCKVDDALAFFIHTNFTKESYIYIRNCAKERNANIFPPYKSIRDAKKECNIKSINVSDSSADVDLQNLADHTAERLLKYLEKYGECENVPEALDFVFKWGCGGSSAHYKRYEGSFYNTDQFLFAISMLPLVLKSNDTVIWTNPTPSSIRFCRPIKLKFEPETNELIAIETTKMEQLISNLKPFTVKFRNRSIIVKYEFKPITMDTETFGAVTESPTQSCSICKATSQSMNNYDVIRTLPVTIDLNQYGIANCYAWIRCMECVLNISYRLDIKKWEMQNATEKLKYEERKMTIQEKLKEELSISFDVVNPDTSTITAGNDARAFFQYYEKTAGITGVSEELIKRLAVVLVCLSGDRKICPNLFKKYALETFHLYTAEYNWYHMPSSLHKILIHGADMIKYGAIPIALIPEEILEERRDDFSSIITEYNACKTLKDVFESFLCSSDILLCAITAKKNDNGFGQPRFEMFDAEVKKLISPEDLDSDDDSCDE